jgi:hypothetical protein
VHASQPLVLTWAENAIKETIIILQFQSRPDATPQL